MIDNLAFTQKPGSNQFLRIADNAPAEFAPKGFKPSAGAQNNDYTYDNVGNQTSDPHKGISSIAYNYLNLPSVITWANGNKIEIQYDAAGMKLSKKVSVGSTEQYTQHYLGGIEYTGTGSTRKLEAIYFADGRVYNTNVTTASSTVALRYEYAIRDHLGNTRIMFADLDNLGTISMNEVLQENHYYPFGMNMEGVWMNDGGSKDNKYTYNGKEINEDFGLNWSDYGARWYDAAVGRWGQVDPLASNYTDYSPYNFVANNPLLYIDPNGKEIWIFFNTENEDGSTTQQKVQYKDRKLYNTNGEAYTGENGYATKVLNDLNNLSTDNTDLAGRLRTLQESKYIHTIQMTDNPEAGNSNGSILKDLKEGKPTGSRTKYNPDKEETINGDKRAPRVGLAHELLGHGWDADQGKKDYSETENGIPMNEVNAVNIENRARAAAGNDKRTAYGGKLIPEKLLEDTHKKKE
jgi:RHS repeat-associated protein